MRRFLPALRWFALALFLFGATWQVGSMAWQRLLDDPGPLGEARDVVVPRGSLAEVADALGAAGVIGADLDDSHWRFRVLGYLTRKEGEVHAGEFAFPAHASLRAVFSVLRAGQPVQHHVTIPEGLTAPQVTALLSRAEAVTGPDMPIAEGSVLPQTYAYIYGTPRSAILARASAALDRALDEAWAHRAAGLPLATPRDALILASIVERETAKPDERPLVAGVFLNRLRAGMRLQSDPTVIFAVSQGMGALDHPLTRAELDRDDAYNTYRNAGLPPGPICAPGLASLLAALHPADTDALYFVADGSGGHVFSRTLAEHVRNVQNARAQPRTAH
jgi:UPF0755 protein